ncbi:MAG: MBL fold metallo-hydrolase [Cyclobacteriaceae bacterium]
MIHVLDLEFIGIQEAIGSFLIETSNGPILIETGPHSTYQNLCRAIKAKGFEPESIQHVLLTHIHLDHAGAAWAFAEKGAKIYVHPAGAKHLASPERLMSSAKRIYQDKMDELWGQMNNIPVNQILECQHEEEITIGNTKITSLHTAGHATHHIAWQLDDTIFTGDVAGVKINDGPVVPPCPPPDINIEHWESSIQLILDKNPTRLFLTHYGEIRDIQEHMKALRHMLRDWSLWIKDKWEAGLSVEDMTPLFSSYTRQQLLDQGLDESAVVQYEAANPSWMSVAGLVRYWAKKEN